MLTSCIIVALFGACVCQTIVRATEPVAILPLSEARTRGAASNFVSPVNTVYTTAYPQAQPTANQQILHTRNQNVPQPRDAEFNTRTMEQREPQGSSMNVEDLLRALGLDEDGVDQNENNRAAERDQNPAEGQQYPATYAYPAKNFVQAPGYQNPVPALQNLVPAPVEDYHRPTSKTISLLKPFALPFASKVSTKISGLLSIVMALLGGVGDTSGLTGFKDILVNGIIKPLFLVKGGLKALIGKLSIPLISLLLINLEVLFTIWWLWEDCGAVHVVAPPPAPLPVYSAPVQYQTPVLYNNVVPNYNNVPSNYNQY